MEAAHRPGRPDGDEDLRRPVRRVRDQRRDAAHRGREGREEDPRHQLRPGGADPRQRRLRRDRRPARDRPGHQRRAEKGPRDISVAAGAIGLAALLVVTGALFGRRALFLAGLVRAARPTDRSGDTPARVRNEAVDVLGQRTLLQRVVPGLMHAFIFWGFLVLFPTILMAMIAAVDVNATLPWLGHQGWYMLLVDVFVDPRARRRRDRRRDPRGGAAAPLRGLAPRRGVPDPRADRRRRADAALLARGADRRRAERVAGAAGRSSRTRCRTSSRRGPRRSASSSGRTSAPSSASSSTCRTRSTCTSASPRSTSGSGGRARAGGSSRCASTFPTTSCASAPRPSPT